MARDATDEFLRSPENMHNKAKCFLLSFAVVMLDIMIQFYNDVLKNINVTAELRLVHTLIVF